MQSNDYKPGVSGWKLDKDGGFEINSASFGSASAVPEPQMIEIEVFNVRQDDLPTDPNDLAEMLSDAQRKAYDAGARGKGAVQLEFYTEDDPDFPTPRLRMFFNRPENIDELCARLKRAASQGQSIRLTRGGMEVLQDGIVRVRFGNLGSEAEDRAIADNALATQYSIKVAVSEAGQHFASGVGAGVDAPKQGAAESVPDFLAMVGATISDTELAKGLRELKLSRATDIREVIASELRPGGLLHRHNCGR